METEKPKRKLFHKERFLEGNRQRWLLVFLACGGVILTLDALGKIQKIDSYFTFLTFLSGSFILGYSGTETMKLFRTSETSENVTQTTQTQAVQVSDSTINKDIKIDSNQPITTVVSGGGNMIIDPTHGLTHNAKEEDYIL